MAVRVGAENDLAKVSLFNGHNQNEGQIWVVHHNVGGLLRHSKREFVNIVDDHYGYRGGHGNLRAKRAGLLIENPTDLHRNHAQYIAEMSGRKYDLDFHVYSAEELKEAGGGVIIPYIKTPEEEEFGESLGAKVWGLESSVVNDLKNKATFHEIIGKYQIPGLEVPDHIIASREGFVPEGLEFVKGIRGLYEHYGMTDYSVGVMIRMEESDGNYGSMMVTEKNGKLELVADGKSDEKDKRYIPLSDTAWNEAFAYTKKYLGSNVAPGRNPRAIISRLIDLRESPGFSMMFKEGVAFSMGWNGQIQAEGAKACIGTTSFIPKDEIIRDLQQRYEQPTADALEELVVNIARGKGIPREALTGPVNFDLMLPGEKEEELRIKRGQSVDGTGIYLAESNPRFTNMTDGILAAIGFERLDPTVENMWNIIRGGISNYDKHYHPDKEYTFDPQVVRDELLRRDRELGDMGVRVFVRMPDDPLGLIVVGNAQGRRRGLEVVNEVLVRVGKRRNQE